MKKLFVILSSMICLAIGSNLHAYQNDGQYSQCEGSIDPCVGQCENGYGSGRFYAGAFGGANWLNIHRINGFRLKTKVGYAVAVSAGYKFDNGFRIEGEVSYRRNNLNTKEITKNISIDSVNFKAKCPFHSWSYMANFLYDFDRVSYYLPNIVPYVGFGVGYTQNHANFKTRVNHQHCHYKAEGKGFAYQAIAGVGYRITDSTTLALEYRYFDGKNRAADHGVGLVLRQSF